MIGVGFCPVCGGLVVGEMDGMGNIFHEQCKKEMEE